MQALLKITDDALFNVLPHLSRGVISDTFHRILDQFPDKSHLLVITEYDMDVFV